MALVTSRGFAGVPLAGPDIDRSNAFGDGFLGWPAATDAGTGHSDVMDLTARLG
jgi:hypothetical protein